MSVTKFELGKSDLTIDFRPIEWVPDTIILNGKVYELKQYGTPAAKPAAIVTPVVVAKAPEPVKVEPKVEPKPVVVQPKVEPKKVEPKVEPKPAADLQDMPPPPPDEPEPAPPAASKSLLPYRAKVVVDYDAEDDSELSIKVGDIVLIEELKENGWSLASRGGSQGWIPTDYVEPL